MSIARVMSIYLSFISGGIATLVTAASGDNLIVVFYFRDPKLGTQISSDAMMLHLVTEQFGSWFPLIILG